MCLGQGLSAIASPDFSACIQFVVIDWALCAFRFGLLLRLGQKAFPGILRFALNKTLENVPRPMYKQAAHLGDATGMRLNQAYLALTEGFALSTAFAALFFFSIYALYIIDVQIRGIMSPANTILFIIIFLVSDLIQDQVSEHFVKKFSNFSFIFDGLFETHFRVFSFLGCFGLEYGCTSFIMASIWRAGASADPSWQYGNHGLQIMVLLGDSMTQN